MSLGQGIECDAEMLETLRLVISKVSPKELEIYAASSPAFSKGGFRKGSIALIRSRIQSMLASKEPVDDHLRRIIREQIRMSLEAGGGNVAVKKQLEKAEAELVALKGAEVKLAKESEVRSKLEAEAARRALELEDAKRGYGEMRQRAERAEAELARMKGDSERHISALIETRLAEEMARFFRDGRNLPQREYPLPISKVIDAIANCPDSELAQWRNAIERFSGAGVLNSEEREIAEAEVRRRYTALHMQGFEKKYRKDGNLSAPREILFRGLSGEIPVVMLIDAHNTLFALQSRYRLPNDHRFPDAKARQWLINDVVQLLENAPNFRAYIVFDGNERSDITASANVHVIYSGGEGEHRADRVLVDQAHYLKDCNAENILIVTNDGELSGLASRYGAKNLAPTDLHSVL